MAQRFNEIDTVTSQGKTIIRTRPTAECIPIGLPQEGHAYHADSIDQEVYALREDAMRRIALRGLTASLAIQSQPIEELL
jgi:hypothetical protein